MERKTGPSRIIIQYNDYKEGSVESDFAIINGTVTDYNNNTYTNGLIFMRHYWRAAIAEDSDEAQLSISYPLNSQYSNLKGTIVLPKNYDISTWGKQDNVDTNATDVWFYGDGKLLYKATNITSSMPFNLDIDTKGVNQLNIKIKTQGETSYIVLTNLALYK